MSRKNRENTLKRLSWALFGVAAFAATTFGGNAGAQDGQSAQNTQNAQAAALAEAEKDVERWNLGAAAVDADVETLRRWFAEAPSILRGAKIPLKGQPLWHTNGELSDEIIREILKSGKKTGSAESRSSRFRKRRLSILATNTLRSSASRSTKRANSI